MGSFKQISVDEASRLIRDGRTVIVDIRDEVAYKQGHVRDAVSVQQNNIQQFIELTDRSKPLICYCYHGFSSLSAADFFVQNGFKEVYSMIGGFEKWQNAFPQQVIK